MRSASPALKAVLGLGSLVLAPTVGLIVLSAAGTFDDRETLGLVVSVVDLLWTAAITIVAIADVVKRPDLSSDHRGYWVLAIVLLGPLVLPVWWWRLIRPLPYSPAGPTISTM